MTTPLNFIFAPFGMDWMGRFAAGCIVWLFGTCPKANGVMANNRASPQSNLCGRNVVATFVLIFCSFEIGDCTQKFPTLLFAVIRSKREKDELRIFLDHVRSFVANERLLPSKWNERALAVDTNHNF
jgi:hypothetical protein